MTVGTDIGRECCLTLHKLWHVSAMGTLGGNTRFELVLLKGRAFLLYFSNGILNYFDRRKQNDSI